jgi:hypothetical protein
MARLTIEQLEKMEKKLLLANEDLAEVFWELEGNQLDEFVLSNFYKIIENAHSAMIEIIISRLEGKR